MHSLCARAAIQTKKPERYLMLLRRHENTVMWQVSMSKFLCLSDMNLATIAQVASLLRFAPKATIMLYITTLEEMQRSIYDEELTAKLRSLLAQSTCLLLHARNAQREQADPQSPPVDTEATLELDDLESLARDEDWLRDKDIMCFFDDSPAGSAELTRDGVA